MPVITKISDKIDKPQKFHLTFKEEKKSVIFLLSLTIWKSAIYDTPACAGFAYVAKCTPLCEQFLKCHMQL